jgi:hypothetical protein
MKLHHLAARCWATLITLILLYTSSAQAMKAGDGKTDAEIRAECIKQTVGSKEFKIALKTVQKNVTHAFRSDQFTPTTVSDELLINDAFIQIAERLIPDIRLARAKDKAGEVEQITDEDRRSPVFVDLARKINAAKIDEEVRIAISDLKYNIDENILTPAALAHLKNMLSTQLTDLGKQDKAAEVKKFIISTQKVEPYESPTIDIEKQIDAAAQTGRVDQHFFANLEKLPQWLLGRVANAYHTSYTGKNEKAQWANVTLLEGRAGANAKIIGRLLRLILVQNRVVQPIGVAAQPAPQQQPAAVAFQDAARMTNINSAIPWYDITKLKALAPLSQTEATYALKRAAEVLARQAVQEAQKECIDFLIQQGADVKAANDHFSKPPINQDAPRLIREGQERVAKLQPPKKPAVEVEKEPQVALPQALQDILDQPLPSTNQPIQDAVNTVFTTLTPAKIKAFNGQLKAKGSSLWFCAECGLPNSELINDVSCGTCKTNRLGIGKIAEPKKAPIGNAWKCKLCDQQNTADALACKSCQSQRWPVIPISNPKALLCGPVAGIQIILSALDRNIAELLKNGNETEKLFGQLFLEQDPNKRNELANKLLLDPKMGQLDNYMNGQPITSKYVDVVGIFDPVSYLSIAANIPEQIKGVAKGLVDSQIDIEKLMGELLSIDDQQKKDAKAGQLLDKMFDQDAPSERNNDLMKFRGFLVEKIHKDLNTAFNKVKNLNDPNITGLWIHSGTDEGGHFFALIKNNNQWYAVDQVIEQATPDNPNTLSSWEYRVNQSVHTIEHVTISLQNRTIKVTYDGAANDIILNFVALKKTPAVEQEKKEERAEEKKPRKKKKQLEKQKKQEEKQASSQQSDAEIAASLYTIVLRDDTQAVNDFRASIQGLSKEEVAHRLGLRYNPSGRAEPLPLYCSAAIRYNKALLTEFVQYLDDKDCGTMLAYTAWIDESTTPENTSKQSNAIMAILLTAGDPRYQAISQLAQQVLREANNFKQIAIITGITLQAAAQLEDEAKLAAARVPVGPTSVIASSPTSSMTPSAVATWMCPGCSYKNTSDQNMCVVCGSKREQLTPEAIPLSPQPAQGFTTMTAPPPIEPPQIAAAAAAAPEPLPQPERHQLQQQMDELEKQIDDLFNLGIRGPQQSLSIAEQERRRKEIQDRLKAIQQQLLTPTEKETQKAERQLRINNFNLQISEIKKIGAGTPAYYTQRHELLKQIFTKQYDQAVDIDLERTLVSIFSDAFSCSTEQMLEWYAAYAALKPRQPHAAEIKEPAQPLPLQQTPQQVQQDIQYAQQIRIAVMNGNLGEFDAVIFPLLPTQQNTDPNAWPQANSKIAQLIDLPLSSDGNSIDPHGFSALRVAIQKKSIPFISKFMWYKSTYSLQEANDILYNIITASLPLTGKEKSEQWAQRDIILTRLLNDYTDGKEVRDQLSREKQDAGRQLLDWYIDRTEYTLPPTPRKHQNIPAFLKQIGDRLKDWIDAAKAQAQQAQSAENFHSDPGFEGFMNALGNAEGGVRPQSIPGVLDDLDTCFGVDALKVFVDQNALICCMGDIHGSLGALIRNLEKLKDIGFLDDNFKIKDAPNKPKNIMVFTGDYVSRGKHIAGVIYTLLLLVATNPERVFLMRGNHEDPLISSNRIRGYNNVEELEALYPLQQQAHRAWNQIIHHFFNKLPYVLFLGIPGFGENGHVGWLQCCHGGVDPVWQQQDFLNDPNKKFEHDLFKNMDRRIANPKINKAFGLDKIIKDQGDFRDPVTGVLKNPDNNGYPWSEFYIAQNEFTRAAKYAGALAAGAPFALQLATSLGIRGWIRGHQHECFGLKIGGETHWIKLVDPHVVNSSNILQEARPYTAMFKFSDAKINGVPCPVFTLSTASETPDLWAGDDPNYNCEPYDSFIILQTETLTNPQVNDISVHVYEKAVASAPFWEPYPDVKKNAISKQQEVAAAMAAAPQVKAEEKKKVKGRSSKTSGQLPEATLPGPQQVAEKVKCLVCFFMNPAGQDECFNCVTPLPKPMAGPSEEVIEQAKRNHYLTDIQRLKVKFEGNVNVVPKLQQLLSCGTSEPFTYIEQHKDITTQMLANVQTYLADIEKQQRIHAGNIRILREKLQEYPIEDSHLSFTQDDIVSMIKGLPPQDRETYIKEFSAASKARAKNFKDEKVLTVEEIRKRIEQEK